METCIVFVNIIWYLLRTVGVYRYTSTSTKDKINNDIAFPQNKEVTHHIK